MSTIAVIGAGGFVGSRLIESCLLDGFNHISAVVRSSKSVAPLARFGSCLDIRFADAKDRSALVMALKDCQIVVNLVLDRPNGIVDSTKAIYEACRIVGAKRLIHMSSAVVFGQVNDPSINDLSDPVRHHWMPYARAKIQSEDFLKSKMDEPFLDIIVLRPGIVWGPRSEWIYNLVLELSHRQACLVEKGEGVCNAIYIDNLVDGIIACCKTPSDSSGCYNVSDDEQITWRDFYKPFADHMSLDIALLPSVPGGNYNGSIRDVFDGLKQTELYHSMKNAFNPETRARIKLILKWFVGTGSGDNSKIDGQFKNPRITKEMWHLQSTRYKLKNAMFKQKFCFKQTWTFDEGITNTIDWLEFVGFRARQGMTT
jgi:nucleoside-diphosphate-sugar epimerase